MRPPCDGSCYTHCSKTPKAEQSQKNHHSRHYGGNEGCYLLLVGVSMKKPIRDNWYIYIIKETLQQIMKLAYRNAKKFIRNG